MMLRWSYLQGILALFVAGSCLSQSSTRQRRPQWAPSPLSDASPGEFPYQALVYDISFRMSFLACGATVYSATEVVTAAHCVFAQDPRYFKVVAGDYDIAEEEGSEQTLLVAEIIVHEEYDRRSHKNDIAILRLDGSFVLGGTVMAASQLLPPSSVNGTCHISGWGVTTVGDVTMSKLQKFEVELLPDEHCQAVYGEGTPSSSTLCAQAPGVRIDSCPGLIGSPLTCYDFEGALLWAGIATGATYCSRPDIPWLYAEAAYYADWIEQHTITTEKSDTFLEEIVEQDSLHGNS